MSDDCLHSITEIRRFRCRNGGLQFVRQCLACGMKRSQAIRRADVEEELGSAEGLADYDERLRESYLEARESARTVAHDARRKAERAEWVAWYAGYLRGDVWARRRDKVLERAGGLCEGCLERPAVDVHHLTYQHIGDELLFELVALCRPCHERAHQQQAEQP